MLRQPPQTYPPISTMNPLATTTTHRRACSTIQTLKYAPPTTCRLWLKFEISFKMSSNVAACPPPNSITTMPRPSSTCTGTAKSRRTSPLQPTQVRVTAWPAPATQQAPVKRARTRRISPRARLHSRLEVAHVYCKGSVMVPRRRNDNADANLFRFCVGF